MYHSTALLLPDGRVSHRRRRGAPARLTAQIYSPPYLFKGARPDDHREPRPRAATARPSRVGTHAPDIAKVALMRPRPSRTPST